MGKCRIFREKQWQHNLADFFGQYEKAYVIGKGPSFFDPSKIKDDKTFIIGVNHAVNFLEKPDALIVQDWNIWSECNAYPRLKYCIFPRHTLIKGTFNFMNPNELAKVVEHHGFNGDIIAYNKLNSPDGKYRHIDSNNGAEISLLRLSSTGYQGLGFIRAFLPNVKKVTTYGMAIELTNSGKTYHPHFRNGYSSTPKYKSPHFHHACRLLMKDVFRNTKIELEIK